MQGARLATGRLPLLESANDDLGLLDQLSSKVSASRATEQTD